jgi:16S rRNA (cytosine1402-N4)-methyltransferase
MTDDGSVPHITVLLKEAVEQLSPRPGGRYVDGTLGAGGHTQALLEAYDDLEVLGIDRDKEALDEARSRLKSYGERIHLVRGAFSEMADFVQSLGWTKVDGILLDLGVSSMQFDRPHRGFSYRFDGPLDMRMDSRHRVTASMVLNNETEGELSRIFRVYGEEPSSRRIARAIVARREQRPLARTSELSEIIQKAAPSRNGRRTAEARCFQALRIAVNDELAELEKTLETAMSLLAIGGRMVVISFHSLEDRLVKRYFVEEAKECICPHEFPVCRCDKESRLKIVTRKPIKAPAEECERNSRSSSARLRVAERI